MVTGLLLDHPLSLGIVLALASVAVLVLVAWLLTHGGAPGPELAAARVLPPERGREVAAAFRGAVRRLRHRNPGRDAVYAGPWVLLLGPPGSGKSAMAGAIGLDRPLDVGLPYAPEDTCALHLFDRGVVIDPAGSLVFGDGADAGGDPGPGWRRLVATILRHRPERGLDAVVVTIPSTSLVGPDRLDAPALNEFAKSLRRRLRDLQHQLGLRLPVYIVITRCDDLAGFTSFWRTAGARRAAAVAGEMIGWSNAALLDSAYTTSLVGEAFDDLGRRLHKILIQSAVATGDISDLAFLFPAQIQKLAGPVRRIADRVFQADAYVDPHFFRGLYFTGAAGFAVPAQGDDPAAPEPAPEALPVPAESMAAAVLPDSMAAAGPEPEPDAAPAVRPNFVTDLFAAKIFSEAAVSRPARRGLTVRSREVRTMQAVLAASVIVLSTGLWLTARSLGRETSQILTPLGTLETTMARALPPAQAAGGGGPTVAGAFPGGAREASTWILREYQKVKDGQLRHLLLPSSWFSSVEDQARTALARGFSILIFDSMRKALDQRWTEIQERSRAVSSAAPSEEEDWRRLIRYLNEMEALSAAASAYNRVDALTPQEFETLVRTLLKVDIGGTAIEQPDVYGRLVQDIRPQPFDAAAHADAAITTLTRLAQAAAAAVGNESSAATPFTRLTDALERASLAQVAGTDASGDVLGELSMALTEVDQLLGDADLNWVFAADPAQHPNWVELETTVAASPFFGRAGVAVLQSTVLSGLDRLRAALLAVRSVSFGPVLTTNAGGDLALVPDLQTLAQTLPPVLKADVFATGTLREPVQPPAASAVVLWMPDPLNKAVAYYTAYEQMTAGVLTKVPDGYRPLITALVAQRVQGAMLTAVADAQVIERRGQDFRELADEAALKREVAQFARAAEPLGAVLNAFNRARFDAGYTTLANILGQHLVSMLGQTDRITDTGEPYVPVNGFRGWDGTLPLNFDGFEVLSDVEMAEYLDSTRGRLEWITAELAKPLITFILNQPVQPALRTNAAVIRWQRILLESQRYQAENPRSTLAALERYILFELMQVKPDTCLDQLAAPIAAADWFSQRQDNVRRLALQRCQALAAGTMQGDYARLATEFNTGLAGRYPFAAYQGPDTPEADPAAVGLFLGRFTAAEPVIRRGLGKPKPGSAAAQALDFVNRMAAVRDFLAPFLAPTSDSPAGYDVEADFRVNRAKESGGNQIIEWTLSVGDQTLVRGGDPARARWAPGAPVTLGLRWAKDAPLVPVASVTSGGVLSADRVVNYEYADRWSLLRMVQAQRAPQTLLPGATDPNPHTLVAAVTTAPAPVPGAPPSTAAPLTAETTVFVRVSLSTLNPDGKTRTSYVLPAFPFAAPRLDSSS